MVARVSVLVAAVAVVDTVDCGNDISYVTVYFIPLQLQQYIRLCMNTTLWPVLISLYPCLIAYIETISLISVSMLRGYEWMFDVDCPR